MELVYPAVSSDRLARMRDGAASLDQWLDDAIARGLATLQSERAGIAARVARLHDAQLPGLARWLGFVRDRVGEGTAWPRTVLLELGRIALVTEGLSRLEALTATRRADVLLRAGVSVRKDAVRTRGVRVRGVWRVLGHQREEDDRGLVTRRTWLSGPRPAVVVDHAFGGAPLPPGLPPGASLDATLAFWPGTAPLRALVIDVHGPASEPAARGDSVPDALARAAAHLARDPLANRIPLVLHGVIPVMDDGRAWLTQDAGALPVAGDLPWALLAASGGCPVDVAVVWTGRVGHPIGVWADGAYTSLDDVAAPPNPVAMGLDPLVRRALLGTDRVGGPTRDGRSPARTLLLDAARRAVRERAGHPVSPPIPAPSAAGPDPRPVLGDAGAGLVRRVLEGPHPELVAEAAARMAALGLAPPADLIPALLGVPEAVRPAVDRVLGPRARWLAERSPEWAWASRRDPDEVWDDPARRAAVVASALAHAPERAREVLRRRFVEVARAADRVALLHALSPHLREDDGDWLEGLLDDGSRRVRQEAADLLVRLPDSPLGRRMRARAETLWRRDPDGWRPRLPDHVPDDWERDGIPMDVSSPAGRMRVWRRVIGAVPPSAWGAPGAVSLADPSALIGVAVAAARHADPAWARHLLPRLAAVPGTGELGARLLRALPAAEAEAIVAALFVPTPDERLAPYLEALGRPWRRRTGRAWLRGLREHLRRMRPDGGGYAAAWLDTVRIAARALPLALVDEALEPLPIPASSDGRVRRWVVAARDMDSVLRTRRRIARTIAVDPPESS